ncbi:MAG: mycoredoxin [Chloroflexi bacterium]|nr:mycoredoxin [Chloroflexota bacterium]
MTDPKITVYGADWCKDCRRAKKFLDEQGIPYQWVDTDADKAAEDFVRGLNNGMRIIPTILFEDGSFLSEPSDAELAQKFNLQLEP